MDDKTIVVRVAMTEKAYRRLRVEAGVDEIFGMMYASEYDRDVKTMMVQSIVTMEPVSNEEFDVSVEEIR